MQFEDVDDFIDDEVQEAVSVENTAPAPKRFRGREKTWIEIASFPDASMLQANEEADALCSWRKVRTSATDVGKKVYFQCSVTKCCLAERYVLYHSNSYTATLFKTPAEHDHSNQDSDYGIPLNTKRAIQELFQNGVVKAPH